MRVILRKEDGHNLTKEKQLGYTAKDIGKRWFHAHYLRNVTLQQLGDYGRAYQQVAGHNVFKGKVKLNPATYMDPVSKYEHSNLYPLSQQMDTTQVVRVMLNTGKYSLSPNWLAASGGFAAPLRATNAYRKINYMCRRGKKVDIDSVARVLSKGRDTADSAFVQEFDKRKREYDTMSVHGAKVRARRLLRRRNEEAAAAHGAIADVGVHENSDQETDFDLDQLGATDDEDAEEVMLDDNSSLDGSEHDNSAGAPAPGAAQQAQSGGTESDE
jgi:hypothetical protein